MLIYQEVTTDVEINLTPREIYMELDSEEKEQLLDLLLKEQGFSKDYSISNKVKFMSDTQILNSKDIWDYIIKLIKYDDSSLKDYIIDELSYEP